MHNALEQTDQANGLRQIMNRQPVQVIAIASGKGGVGKTSISINLAFALSQKGKRVILLDADLGLANIDVMLGLQTEFNLAHLLNGQCGINDILVQLSDSVSLIPAASGISQMSHLSDQQHAGIVRAFSELDTDVDTLIVDNAAGISNSVTGFARSSNEVVVVVCDEPASLTDAYALIKVLSRDHETRDFNILVNMVRRRDEGRKLFSKLNKVSSRFLDVKLNYLGSVPFDDSFRRAIQHQQVAVKRFPRAGASLALKSIAENVTKWPKQFQTNGGIEFFVERLVDAQNAKIGGRNEHSY